MRSLRRAAGAAVLLSAATTTLAQPAEYRLDPVHTRVMFAVSHAGFSQALGTVSGSTGTLLFDPGAADWAGARVEVRVPLDRADLGDAKWNRAAMAANLLDVATHPQATFVSTRIEPIDPRHASVHGTLTLHGVSKDVTLAVTLNAAKRHPLPPFRRTAGFSATTTLSRKAFGIDAWPSVIGDAVELRIEAEATRGRCAARDDDGNPAPGDDAPAAPVPADGAQPASPVPSEADPDPTPPPATATSTP